jgi:hypothetical protein
MNVLEIIAYWGILILVLIFLPSINILPLPTYFIDFLSTLFDFMKMIRAWPILRVLWQGFDILLWFLAIKLAWNLAIFAITLFEKFERIKKLKI